MSSLRKVYATTQVRKKDDRKATDITGTYEDQTGDWGAVYKQKGENVLSGPCGLKWLDCSVCSLELRNRHGLYPGLVLEGSQHVAIQVVGMCCKTQKSPVSMTDITLSCSYLCSSSSGDL